MAKIKLKHVNDWWTRGLESPPKSGEATAIIEITPQKYYEKCKEYYIAYDSITKYQFRGEKASINDDAKALYFKRADGRCGNMKEAMTSEEFKDFWMDGKSEKWRSDGFNNNTHPTELSPDYLGVKYVEGTKGYFVLWGSVNRHEELYLVWQKINHDNVVTLFNFKDILREFDLNQYMEVLDHKRYYHRNYPNELYVNGISKYDLRFKEKIWIRPSKSTRKFLNEKYKEGKKVIRKKHDKM